MTHNKPILLIFAAVLLLAGCQRDLGLDGPSGTYLSLDLNLPESGDSTGARFIHSDADELTVSLTYQGEDPIVVTFDLDSSDPGTVLVEDLEPGDGVVLEVSVGLEDSDIKLSSASTTLDILAGANSPASLTLKALNYTVHGTLYDENDQILTSHAFKVDGVDVVTDINGLFSLNISTDEIVSDDYMKFQITNGNVFDIARTNLYLLQHKENFRLKAHPEILLDFTVKCEQYVLPGTSYEIWQGYISDGELIASGVADADGKIFYQNTDYSYSGEHEILISYNDTFIDKRPHYSSAPGAVVDDVVMEPYAFFTSYNGSRLFYRAGPDFMESEDLSTTIAPDGAEAAKVYTDYTNGKIYLWTRDSDLMSHYITVIDDWDTVTTTGSNSYDIGNTFSYGINSSSYSVQQLLLLEDGNLLVVASYGAFIFDTTSNTVTTVWENSFTTSLVLNGAYQDSNGTIFALGVNRSGSSITEQKIYKLSDDGTYSEYASLGATFSTFTEAPSLDTGGYIYLMGLYQWGTKIVSANLSDTEFSYINGKVVLFDPSPSTFTLSGSPVEKDEGGSNNYSLVRPVGVLPDNKFYFVEEEDYNKKVYRLDDSDNPTLSLYVDYSGGSLDQENSFYYFYEEMGE